jgi:putative solute:sodium symporter small subunit
MTPSPTDDPAHRRWQICLRVTAWLLAIGFVVTFGVAFFARQLSFSVLGWPFSFWVAAQGGVLVYVAITWVYARRMARLERRQD